MPLHLPPTQLHATRDSLRSIGYSLVRNLFDPAGITAEVDWAIAAGCRAGFRLEGAPSA